MNGLPRFGAAVPRTDPQHAARTILSQARFRVAVAAPARRTWWDAVRDWLGARWHDLMQALFGRVHIGKAGAALGDIVLIALVLVVIFVLIRLLASAVRVGSLRSAGRAPGAAPDAAALHEMSLAAAARGDYALAIVLLFRAALAALDVQGVVHDDPSRTVNECRRAVRAKAPPLAADFDAIARPFTAVLYAGEPVTEAQWRAALQAFTRFPQAADA